MNWIVISAIAVAPHVSPHFSPAPARVAPKPAVVPAPRPPIIVPPHINSTPKCDDKKEKCK